ncbi:MAG: S1C family serine protease [Trueperaceae bacterium]
MASSEPGGPRGEDPGEIPDENPDENLGEDPGKVLDVDLSELSGERPDRPPVRRATWLLLLLLAALGLLAGTFRPFMPPDSEPHVLRQHPSIPEAPPAIAATGRLAEVYRETRPAALRIESRCANPLFRAAPIDVGSGFFVSPEGRVLTAYHVVRRQTLSTSSRCALHYVAIDSDGREYQLELGGFDAYLDLAMMQARVSRPVPYLELSHDLPSVGTDVLAIGNSRGELLADRTGTVTRLGVRADRPDFATGTIELTAALAPGDSGGPVIGEDGRVLGVVSYISFEPSFLDAEGDLPLAGIFGANSTPDFASYAVPTPAASETVIQVLAGEMRDVPVIGFEVAFEYDPRVRDAPGLGRRPGVVVGRVQPNGPGEQAGLRSLREQTLVDVSGQALSTQVMADVIVAVDGRPTSTFERLLELVRAGSVGDEVTLTVQRGNETTQVGLQLAGYRQIFR